MRRKVILLCTCLLAAARLVASEVALGVPQGEVRVVLRPVTVATLRLLPVPETVESGTGAACPAQAPLPFLDYPLCPIESRLFADAADRHLGEFGLLEAGLVASGVECPEQLKHYQEQFGVLVEQLADMVQGQPDPRDKAATIFEFLHRRVLHGGYYLECTDLRTALDEGRFNCVSASVLFCCLAEACGLEVCGLEMPGHAMARIRRSGDPLDVETTCRRWFDLLDDPAGQAEAVRRTLGTDLSARYAQAREVSPIEMAAMIYYNRGVDLLSARQYDGAAIANAKALRLDPASTTAHGNLLATVNNWAVALSAEGRYQEASTLLRDGMRFDREFEAFSLNFVHVHHEWVNALCQAGQFEQAADALKQAAVERPDLDYFQHSVRDVYQRWIAALRAAGEVEEADRLADRVAEPKL